MTSFLPVAGSDLTRTTLCFVLIWLLFDRLASALGSLKGEAGLLVCAIVLSATVACEWVLGRRPLREIAFGLGLRRPHAPALMWTAVLVLAMAAAILVSAGVRGFSLALVPSAAWFALGIFAQGGVAEEVLFRGFLFRRLRATRPFWRAAWVAAIPFVGVHMLLFLTMDFATALAAVLLAVSLSFPLAWLFEASGNSIWPPAIVHAVIQGVPKVVASADAGAGLIITWIAISGTTSWLLLLLPRRGPVDVG